MKFGKQLKTNSYPPWTDKYLAYGKFKRMLKRYGFQRNERKIGDEEKELEFARKEAEWAASSPSTLPSTSTATERTALRSQQPAGESAAALGAGSASVRGETRGGGGARGGGARRATTGSTSYGGVMPSPSSAGTMTISSPGVQRPPLKKDGRDEDRDWESGTENEGPAVPDLYMNLKTAEAEEHEQFIRFRRQQSAVEGMSVAKEFFDAVDQDLHRVESFYLGMLAELDQMVKGFEESVSMPNSWSVLSGNQLSQFFKAYTELTALQTFSEMNGEGFRKIVKKYDKTMGSDYLNSSFLTKLQKQNFYQASAPGELLERIQGMVSRDKLLDMKRAAAMAHADESSKVIFPAVKWSSLMVSIALFILVWMFRPDLGGNVHASRCLTMLVFVTSLWVTEAIPYFVTAMLIPVLVVLMDIMEDSEGADMKRTHASHVVLSHMVNHTTILIMGGYSISSAFSRCEIELRIASALQKKLGRNPRLFILGIMYLGLLLSMLISNHTAPVLCVSILMPIIRDFDVNSRFAKTLLLGLAFACNFGGMVTPISSMQNVVAQQSLENVGLTISFGMWIAVGVPFCVVGVFLAWVLLCVIINPNDVKEIPVIIYNTKANIVSRKNVFIVSMTLITIFGWSSIGYTEDYVGDLGIIALLFIIIAFGSGILSEVDFNSFSWHTLFLLGGGSVLGKAISSSQLLDILAHGIVGLLPKDNHFMLLVDVVTVTLLISTFVSHTVAALILMPLIVKVGVTCKNPVLLGMGAALAVSSGCALPFSSFPNVTCLLVTDDHGRKYLVVKDFVTSGLPMSLVSIAMISTMGYALIDWFLIPSVLLNGDDDADFPALKNPS